VLKFQRFNKLLSYRIVSVNVVATVDRIMSHDTLRERATHSVRVCVDHLIGSISEPRRFLSSVFFVLQ
jgi:hypothetical protein